MALFRGAEARHHQPAQRFAGDQPRGRQHAGVFDARLLRVVEVALVAVSCRSPSGRCRRRRSRMWFPDGRYMPTENSIGLFTSIRIRPKPIRIPTTTSGQAMLPPTMPLRQRRHQPRLRRRKLRRAEGVGAVQPHQREKQRHAGRRDAQQVARSASWPACRPECARPSDLAASRRPPPRKRTPPPPRRGPPRCPRCRAAPWPIISSAATTSVHSVRPETGLFEEPIIPTRLPETAAKKNPSTIMTIAAAAAPASWPAK